jgi:pyruvate dehydrogenase E2 component (dihydrolipoamide acetyltransferase)
MSEIIRMPEVLAGATEAAIQTWLVTPGTVVAVGQPLAEIETDKAIVELSAEVAGTVARLLVAEGDSVAVGEPIIAVLAPGEDPSAVESVPEPDREPEPAREPEPEPEPSAGPGSAPVSQGAAGTRSAPRRLFASPLVRRLAAQQGVDLALVTGTGPNGRVVRRDLERHLEAASTQAPAAGPRVEASAPQASTPAPSPVPEGSAAYEDVPLDRMRRAIARRLTESKTTVPHFYLVADCRVDALLALRAEVNAAAARKVSVNDFVLKAVAGALTDVPEANAIWNGDSIRRFSTVDVAVAVATDGGLSTPVLRGVERMPLTDVSATVGDLVERARAGRLRQHELEGGSFSVSNLGMYGTTQFSAILNPPHAGILAVGAARKAPVVDAEGQLTVGAVMTVTLSADHRVLDGAVAAQWLAAFQRRIENPLTILI